MLIWVACVSVAGTSDPVDLFYDWLRAESCAKLARLKQHLPVRSKVKQQLEQAKALHEQKQEARKERLKSALGLRYPPCSLCCLLASTIASMRVTSDMSIPDRVACV